jgi:hypothetical protein
MVPVGTSTCCNSAFCLGDLDHDGDVDLSDLAALLGAYGDDRWLMMGGRSPFGLVLRGKVIHVYHDRQRSRGGLDTANKLLAVCRKYHDRVNRTGRWTLGSM